MFTITSEFSAEYIFLTNYIDYVLNDHLTFDIDVVIAITGQSEFVPNPWYNPNVLLKTLMFSMVKAKCQ